MRLFFFICCLLCAIPFVNAQTITAQETGYASYIANYLDGRRTAHGEIYNKNKLTAAHRTYPLGTLVNITRLDNGKSITVRINDKGPFDESRIIDVSYAAAEVLDLVYDGIAMVRTQVVDAEGNPIQAPRPASPVPSQTTPRAYNQVEVPISYDYKPQFKPQNQNTTTKSVPASNIPATSGLPGNTPSPSPYQTDLQPKSPEAINQPNSYDAIKGDRIQTASASGFFVQVGAFSKRDNAQNLLNTLSTKGFNNAQIQSSGQLFKTLVGPYANADDAKKGQSQIVQEMQLKGFVTQIK